MLTSDASRLGAQAMKWAIRVHDLSQARAFYGGLLGCREAAQETLGEARGLSFDLFGARLAVQLSDAGSAPSAADPVGVCLSLPQWRNLAQRLMAAGTRFEVPPHCHHEGQAGDRWTMFIRDPSGNALEICASEHEASPRWH